MSNKEAFEGKEYLRSLWDIKTSIKILKEERDNLYNTYHSISYDDVRVAGNGDASMRTYLQLEKKEEELDLMIKAYIMQRDDVIDTIMKVPVPVIKEILYMRFVEHIPVARIARKLNYSESAVKKNILAGYNLVAEILYKESK